MSNEIREMRNTQVAGKSSPHEDLYEAANQADDLVNYNAYETDMALRENVRKYGGGWAESELLRHGARTGSAEVMQWGDDANRKKPELQTYDRRGRRIDLVRFDDSYHSLMALSTEFGTHSGPWKEEREGAHVVRSAHAYLQTQVDAGHECPIAMTYSCVPSIRMNEAVSQEWLPKILADGYDGRNVPYYEKQSVTIGMGMTEKQGGTDVRTNVTVAEKEGNGTGEDVYALYGHKWFTSAPMCDAFLMLAQTEAGMGCFLVPRWRPDGKKNQVEIQRLKEKLGNVSNASSELVLRGAMGWRIGEEGRGIAAIMHMVALTRLDCMIQGAAGQRQAIAQAVNHCKGRVVFGRTLINQPLMRNVLADLQLEMEGGLALLMRMAKAMDGTLGRNTNEYETLLARVGLAVGKYWITKRTPSVTYEALECMGGNGAIEEYISARLYRDAPINAIWEGAGNVQALDIKRAIAKEPEVLDVWFAELERHKGADADLDRAVRDLKTLVGVGDYHDYSARSIIEKMALTMQAALLRDGDNAGIAELFIASRLGRTGAGNFGTLPESSEIDRLLQRADPLTGSAIAHEPEEKYGVGIGRARTEEKVLAGR